MASTRCTVSDPSAAGDAADAAAVDDVDDVGAAATGVLDRVSSHVCCGPRVRQPTTSTYEKSPTGGSGLGCVGSTRMASSPSVVSSCVPAGNPFSFST